MKFLPPGQRVVLASSNVGKLKEIRFILADLDLDLILQSELKIPEAEETGTTFVENSLLKARHASAHARLPAIADDSGLEVFALNGAPGVHSARYAGPNATDQMNNEKLLQAMRDLEDEARAARFHCVVTAVRRADDPTPLVCHGKWDGTIIETPKGANGFGYDPLFMVNDLQLTSAELAPGTKNQVSHRARAFNHLIEKLRAD